MTVSKVLLIGFVILAARLHATTYEVGAGQPFATIASVPQPQAGDIVNIHCGTFHEVRKWTSSGTAASPVILQGACAAGRPVIDADGLDTSGNGSIPRAAWEINGSFFQIRNLEFKNAHNGSSAAGIRVLSANVTITNCLMDHNDIGFLTSTANADNVVVQNSEIAFNGTGDLAGSTHNVYLTAGMTVTFQFCYIHDAISGENFKSRAHYTQLFYNYIAFAAESEVEGLDGGNTGTANSNMTMIGNILVSTPNRTINTIKFINFGQDVGGPHNGTLYLINNTLVAGTPQIGFLRSSASNSAIVAVNNIFYGSNNIVQPGIAANISGSNNWFPATASIPPGFTSFVTGIDPGLVNATQSNFQLTTSSTARNIGLANPSYLDGNGVIHSGVPTLEYVSPLGSMSRPTGTGLDAGAYQFTGPTPPSGAAAFVKADTTTGGSWKGVYGAEGYNIVNDSVTYPSYVAVTPLGNSSYTWASSTVDIRALQKGVSTTDRMAACWYTAGALTIDLTFNDVNTHQVTLYMLDWDSYGGGRTQRVDLTDSNGNPLDTRTVSSFVNGQYLVWNLSGHVVIRVTNTNAFANAVISGLLFGGAGSGGGGTPTATAAFVKADTTTGGSWKGVYGGEGYNIINDSASYPSYVAVTPSGNSSYTWATSTADLRGLQKGASTSDRVAACWYTSSTLTIDFAFNDANTHQVALYMLDWDTFGGGRTQRVDLTDAGGNALGTRTVSSFVNGQYLVWNMSGHVIVRITNTGANAVISGIFFGGAGSAGGGGTPTGTAAFLSTDTTTSGSWKGVYGADGYTVLNDSVSYPSYVTVSASGNSSYTWASSTSDTRGLQKVSSSTDRIASCWYSSGAVTINLTFNDSNTHRVALYMMDWDLYGGGRTQRVDVFDSNGTPLDTRSVSGFRNGQYLVWNLTGRVVIQITNTNGFANAVMSGLFFR